MFTMMHNAFPHVHLFHETVGEVEVEGEFHHHHHHDVSDHHHHSEEDRSKHEQRSLFEFLFEKHSHTNHSHQYTAATVELVKKVKQIVVEVIGNTGLLEFPGTITEIGLLPYIPYKDMGSTDPYLNSPPLRGPPA